MTSIPKTQTESVFQCIKDLHNSGQRAHRKAIALHLGRKLETVDDHIKLLHEGGQVRRTSPGCVEPVKQWRKDQPISVTHLEDGEVLVEKGNATMEFTPSEWRKLSSTAMGAAVAFSMGAEG